MSSGQLITAVKRSKYVCIISASLSVNIASVNAHGIELSPIPSVGRSVCQSVSLSGLDPDAVWDGEWGQWRDECIRRGPRALFKGKSRFGERRLAPISFNGVFV